jgi:hypothetical protein
MLMMQCGRGFWLISERCVVWSIVVGDLNGWYLGVRRPWVDNGLVVGKGT